MILWAALLMSLTGASAGLERIEECGIRCSQGLQCKSKPHSLFPPPCQIAPEGLNTSCVFPDVSLSTVMRCEGRQKCSLLLRVSVRLQLTESVHGVSICTVSAGMMEKCQNVSFKKASRERMSGLQVDVDSDCTDVFPSQQAKVTVKTVPSYCGVTWTGAYQAPECTSDDLRRHVPECITGRLSYDVEPQRKELIVGVSDMLEDHDYRLRLCHKDFICLGTGINALIKKDDAVRSVIFPYSRPLPCLCVEGWSDTLDAPRVRVCPFEGRLEELWFGITFDPLEAALSWEPACPVAAAVVLCQSRGEVCEDLPHASRNVSREKITFAKVDPHPQLCMKFTSGSQAWTRCPFADARFQAWEAAAATRDGLGEVSVSSRTPATFSVELCGSSQEWAGCRVLETHTVHVDTNNPVGLTLAGELCGSCLQVKRLDVEFAPTVIRCFERCSDSSLGGPVVSRRASWDLTWIVVPAGVFLSGIIIVILAFHVLLTVCRRCKPNRSGCMSGKQTDLRFHCVVPALHTKPVLHGGVLIPDSPQCGNAETANLISD